VAERWSVHATEDACAIAMRSPGAGRVAHDEVFVPGRIPPDIRAAVVKVDPAAVIREASEGWDELVLSRDDAVRVWPRLTELPLPDEGSLQGPIAGVLVRAFASPERVALFVRPPVADHLRRRIEEERR
jgi:hypothetical protein